MEGASRRENWASEDQGPCTAGTKGRSRKLRPAPEDGRLPGELEGKPEGQTGWSCLGRQRQCLSKGELLCLLFSERKYFKVALGCFQTTSLFLVFSTDFFTSPQQSKRPYFI